MPPLCGPPPIMCRGPCPSRSTVYCPVKASGLTDLHFYSFGQSVSIRYRNRDFMRVSHIGVAWRNFETKPPLRSSSPFEPYPYSQRNEIMRTEEKREKKKNKRKSCRSHVYVFPRSIHATRKLSLFPCRPVLVHATDVFSQSEEKSPHRLS